jgi:hypothetical protein
MEVDEKTRYRITRHVLAQRTPARLPSTAQKGKSLSIKAEKGVPEPMAAPHSGTLAQCHTRTCGEGATGDHKPWRMQPSTLPLPFITTPRSVGHHRHRRQRVSPPKQPCSGLSSSFRDPIPRIARRFRTRTRTLPTSRRRRHIVLTFTLFLNLQNSTLPAVMATARLDSSS